MVSSSVIHWFGKAWIEQLVDPSTSLDFYWNASPNFAFFDHVMGHVFSWQAKHMVIPYMPMLIPPICWTGFVFVAYKILLVI